MSEYPEYAELQGLRAEDNRRRAGELAKTRKKIALKRELLALALGMHSADDRSHYLRATARGSTPHPRGPRWQRRRLLRIAARYDAIARTYRRALVETNRAYHPPVIKKGLTR
ncbi:hypothetical protein CRM73_00295 [Kocuria sp. CCUG 69068]|uniref:hypothetical protein n=1 Tax=Kocuria sp. CCUG 69068 TaxID=2043138 RepID=UPI001E2D84FF|nr:hypothetical protein [Kocuria sp. CCUG 69068]